MKKFFILVSIIICVLTLVSCNAEDEVPPVKVYTDAEFSDNDALNIAELKECDFFAQYIRTNGYHDGICYPIVTVIHSVEELRAYYEANKDKYSLERRTGTIYSDATIGFLDACDKYDEAYFEDKILLMVLLEEGSGSIRHKVTRVASGADGTVVEIATIVPEEGTADMAEWHIIVELEAGVVAEKDITVFIDDQRYTEDNIGINISQKEKKPDLTLEEVVGLAENRGEELTWSDFKMYNATETGSGLYILVYEIDETFDLMIGGTPASSPMYIRLVTKEDRDNYIDIRTEDVRAFVSEAQGKSNK